MTVALIATVVGLPAAATAQQAILDTSQPFAPGAAEHKQLLGVAMGWGTYQEGVADGLHYRFDPDGYARFGSDARLGPEAWEVVCTSWPEPDCTGRRGAIVLTLATDGQSEIEIAGADRAARFRLGGAGGDALTLADIATPVRRAELMAAISLIPVEGGPALPTEGLATVARYMRWAEARGAVETEKTSTLVDLARPAPARTERPPALDAIQSSPPAPSVPSSLPAAGPGSPSTSSIGAPVAPEPAYRTAMAARADQAQPVPAKLILAALDDTLRTLPAVGMSRAGIKEPAVVLGQSSPVLPQSAEVPRNCPALPSLPVAQLGDAMDTLRGITGVYVLTEYLAEPGDLKGRLRPQLRQIAEERLRAAGFRVLSRQEVDREPGKPRLEFYLTPGNSATGCPFRVSVSLRQEIVLVGDPSIHLLSGTWSDGGISDNGLAEGSELQTLSFYLDRFIDDWRTANSGEPRIRRRPEATQSLVPKKSLGEKVDKALSVSVAATMPLNWGKDESESESGAPGRQGGEASSSPTLSTTLSLTWPDTGWFGRLTLYDYLVPSRQQSWNPDFAYSFGYDTRLPDTLSLTYSNYGGNRFNPDSNEEFTRPEEGSIRLGYALDIEDRLLAPRFTEINRTLRCEPAVTTNPTYSDEKSGNLHNFKTSLSFGCRYPIWRDALYAGLTAFFYPFPDQQQEWDPDFTYSFGWAPGRPGSLSLEYSNYSGNRWPWRDKPGNGGFLEGALTLSYSLPLGDFFDWIGGGSPVLP